MTTTAIRQRPSKSLLGDVFLAIFCPFTKQIKRVDSTNGKTDIRPVFPPPVQERPALGAETTGFSWVAVVVLEEGIGVG